MPKRFHKTPCAGKTAPEKRFAGKLALITGANRGIGLAIARGLAREGCDLIITGRDSRSLASAGRELGEFGVDVLAQVCDVRDPNSVDYLFVLVRGLRRPLDFLINNAGIGHSNRRVTELPYPMWAEVIDTNLNGMFLVTQAALAVMKKGSTIVNNLSIAAERVFPGSAAYNASKHGALGFTDTLREELRPKGIRVVALMPGATDTAIWKTLWPKAPRRKMMSAETVAGVVVNALLVPDGSALEKIVIMPADGAL
jgi:NAD(P)-dependent dehydrogenase (short-subunit alcohol dehydrogenase family)